jgi:DNA-3-methyladenine glycosylase
MDPTMPLSRRGPAPPPERRRLQSGLLQEPPEAARFLLGQVLVRETGTRQSAVRIVETEAYLGVGDEAAHAFRGRTARTGPIWGPPGTLYVYFIYGMHYCLNIVVEAEGQPGCVLVRAAEPLAGSGLDPLDCRGPGRLCRALEIDVRSSGVSAFRPGSGLYLREGSPPARVSVSTRIGIRQAADRPLRFFDASSPAVSRHPASPGRRPRRTPRDGER